MRKLNVVACTLTSAIAVSFGSINVFAAPDVSAPVISSENVVSPETGNLNAPTEKDGGAAVGEAISSPSLNIFYDTDEGEARCELKSSDKVVFLGYEVSGPANYMKKGSLADDGTFSFKPDISGTYTIKVLYKPDAADYDSDEPMHVSGTLTVSATEKESLLAESESREEKSPDIPSDAGQQKVSASSEEPSGLNGKVSVSYNVSNGVLKAVSDVNGSKNFVWYKNGSEFSKTQEITPVDEGSYYCVMTDKLNPKDTSTSRTITLYKVTGDKDVTFNSPRGLYEAGSNVTATVKLYSDESVKKWKCSIKNIEVSTSGNTASFRMPNRSIKFTAKKTESIDVTINGGKASKSKINSGDTFTIMANNKDGYTFSGWSVSGAKKVENSSSSVTKVTAGTSDITINANFTSNPSSSSSSSYSSSYTEYSAPVSAPEHVADAKHAVYEVLDAGGYNVKVVHHSQGPLCDAAFKYAQGKDWLVTDYFNITVNDNLTTYEIPNSVKIKLTIPSDLRLEGRKWRMVCISKGGVPFSFEDEDTDDTTITFTTNKFYAYAMCYSDYVEPEPSPVPEISESDYPEVDYDDNYDDSYKDPEYPAIDTSTIHPASDSRIIGEYSDVKDSEYSNTYTIYNNGNDYDTEYLSEDNGSNGSGYSATTDAYSPEGDSFDTSPSYDVPASSESSYASPIQSDKKSAVEKSGNKTPTIYSL